MNQEGHKRIKWLCVATMKVISRGGFMGIKANGNHFYITWLDLFRIGNGKLAEAWIEMDTQDFRNQLTESKVVK